MKKQSLKKISFLLSTILFSSIFIATPHAIAADTLTLVAEDSFEYTGNVVGKNGGTGFTSAWVSDYGSSDYGMNSSGLTYSGLTTAGGYMYGCTATPNTVCGIKREIPVQSSGITYIQFLAHFGSQTGGGTPMIRLFDASGALTGGIGANGGTYGSKVSILDATGNPPSDGSASAGTLNSQSLVIVRIDYSNNSTSMWLNPDLSTFSYLTPPTATVSLAGLAPVVKNIAFYSRNTYSKFDELKVYKIVSSSNSNNDAARLESERKRREAVEEAQRAIVRKVENRTDVLKSDLNAADLNITNPTILSKANSELLTLATSNPVTFQSINKIVIKYSLYDKIASGDFAGVYARDLVSNGIVNTQTPCKNSILNELTKLSPEKRDSIEEINTFISEKTSSQLAQKLRLAKTIAKVYNR